MDLDADINEVLPPRRAAAASKAAAAADKLRQKAGAPVRNKAGRKPSTIIRTPKASDADGTPDEFHFSDTPPPPPPAKAMASRKKQNHTVAHHQQQQRHQQPPPRRTRDDDNDSDSSRFSRGYDDDDDDDEKDQKNYNGKLAANITRGNTRNSNNRRDVHPASLDIINVDDDDNDDASARSSNHNIGNRWFDGVPVDGYVNKYSKEYIDNLNRSLGNGCHSRDSGDDIKDDAKIYAASRKGTATASAAAGKRNNFRGNQHKPSSMAQSLSPHKKGSQRIPRKSRFVPLGSRISQFADPLDEAKHLQDCNRRSAFYNDSNNHSVMTETVDTGKASLANANQRSTTNNNYSRAGISYTSQSRGTANNNNSMAGVKFGGGSMDTKRAQHTNAASHRSETQLHQQHQQPMGNVTSGIKRILVAAVDLVTSPLKKKLRSSSPEEGDVNSDDPNSDVAVYSVESHPTSWPAGMNTNNNDDDDGYVDIMNACGQPLRTEDIHGMTPPPSTESVEDLENSQTVSETSALWGFGVKRYTKDRIPGK